MHTNKLINESSPYLLQHAHNPVNWLPWNNTAFEHAKKENKLVLVSIGYSACHWCHVMEHESFMDEEVASLMNSEFINIKVDREERPDVDALYMTAVQLMRGQGGWPLNCFVLPDGRPVFGGTYFTKDQWMNTLANLSNLYRYEKEKVLQYATNLTNGIKQTELIQHSKENKGVFNNKTIEKCIAAWKNRFDTVMGGNNHAPKFPLPVNYRFLLKYGLMYNDTAVLKQVNLTLTKMACGAIYDQLQGGFARYSTDMQWKIPHFEKMLYDNAQLITLYCEAYRYTKNPFYKRVVTQTIEFVLKEWESNEHGFYSALDADSDGKEGKYYVWTPEELRENLKENYELFCDYFRVIENGYWEDENYVILHTENTSPILQKHNISSEELEKRIEDSRIRLCNIRNERTKPGLDNKIIACWNGLMCKALCDAYLSFGTEEYKNKAVKNALFIKNHLLNPDFSLQRCFDGKKAKIDGFLDDYAFVADAFLGVYTITADESWLKLGREICDYVLKHFVHNESNLLYFTRASENQLAIRTTEVSDNVIPSSNSQMAANLLTLGMITGNRDYIRRSAEMTGKMEDDIAAYGEGYSNWASVWLNHLHGCAEVCIVGKDVNEKTLSLHQHYFPNAIFVLSASASEMELLQGRFVNNKTLIYVCKNNTCMQATESNEEAVRLIETLS